MNNIWGREGEFFYFFVEILAFIRAKPYFRCNRMTSARREAYPPLFKTDGVTFGEDDGRSTKWSAIEDSGEAGSAKGVGRACSVNTNAATSAHGTCTAAVGEETARTFGACLPMREGPCGGEMVEGYAALVGVDAFEGDGVIYSFVGSPNPYHLSRGCDVRFEGNVLHSTIDADSDFHFVLLLVFSDFYLPKCAKSMPLHGL